MTAKKITQIALFTTAALAISLLENAFPPLLSFAPGTKMGLANFVTLVVMFTLGVGEAAFVTVARCLLGALFGGNYFGLIYSLTAGFASLAAESLLVRFLFPTLSVVAISFIGATVHNGVQLAIASLAVETNLLPMLPLFLLSSAIAGLFVGFATYFFIKATPKRFFVAEGKSND